MGRGDCVGCGGRGEDGAAKGTDDAGSPRAMLPDVPNPPSDKPRRSSSIVVCLEDVAGAARSSSSDPLEAGCGAGFEACAVGSGSGSKSMRDSSLAEFLPTPVVVPKVPLGMLFAALTLPAFMSL